MEEVQSGADRNDGIDPFPSTRWSVVCAAVGSASQSEADTAWRELIDAYRRPIERSIERLARRYSVRQRSVAELSRDFFTYLYSQEVLRRATRSRGRFRAFVQAVARNFMRAETRTIARDRVSLEGLQVATEDPRSHEDEETRTWATAILEAALAKLSARRPDDASMIVERFGLSFDGGSRISISADPGKRLAERLGITEGALRVRMHRALRFLRSSIRAEIAGSVSTREEFDAELTLLGARIDEAVPELTTRQGTP